MIGRIVLVLSLGFSLSTTSCGSDDNNGRNCGTLVEDSGHHWWVLSQALPSSGSVTLRATFTLNAATSAVFSATPADTLQLWSSPSANEVAPTFASSPAGQTVATSQQFAYELTVNVSTLTSGDTNLGFRPVETTSLGTIGPDRATLASSSVTCR